MEVPEDIQSTEQVETNLETVRKADPRLNFAPTHDDEDSRDLVRKRESIRSNRARSALMAQVNAEVPGNRCVKDADRRTRIHKSRHLQRSVGAVENYRDNRVDALGRSLVPYRTQCSSFSRGIGATSGA